MSRLITALEASETVIDAASWIIDGTVEFALRIAVFVVLCILTREEPVRKADTPLPVDALVNIGDEEAESVETFPANDENDATRTEPL